MKKLNMVVLFCCSIIAISGCSPTVDENDLARLTAQDDNASVTQGGSVVIDVLANDTFAPNPDEHNITQEVSAILNVSQLQKGTAAINSDHTTVTYTANPGTSGDETFTYNSKVTGERPSGSFAVEKHAQVTVHITEAPNEPPRAYTQSIELKCNMGNDASIDIELAGVDPEGEPLDYKITMQPSFGTVTEPIGNLVTYTTQKCELAEQDWFTFRVSDGVMRSEEANVTIAFIH